MNNHVYAIFPKLKETFEILNILYSDVNDVETADASESNDKNEGDADAGIFF